MSERVVGLLGRTPATRPVGLKLLEHYTGALPSAPATFDHTNGWDRYEMLGNGPDPNLRANHGQPVGDCAFVGSVNMTVVTSLEAFPSIAPSIPTSDTVVTTYLDYDSGQDVGANLSELLEYWRSKGLPWGKIAGYAPVGLDDQSFWNAVNIFGAGYIGISVTSVMQQQFAAGEPWALTHTSADHDVIGGHCVVVPARTNMGGELITWAARQAFTEEWFHAMCEEAWVAITPEQVKAVGDGYGINLAQLESDLKNLSDE